MTSTLEKRVKQVLGITLADLEKIVLSKRQNIVDVLIRNGCNLNCNHCFAGPKKIAKYDVEKIRKIMRAFDRVFIYPLEITAGDTDLMLELMKETNRKRILTNGVAIGKNPQLLDKFKQYGIRELSIGNVEAVDEETQSKLTGEGESLKYTFKGIVNGVNKGFKVGVYTVVSRANLSQIEDIIKKVKSLGASSIRFYRFLAIGKGAQQKDLMMNAKETEEFVLKVFSLRKKYKNKIRISLSPTFGPDLYSKTTLRYLVDKNAESRYVCYAASPNYIAVEPLVDKDLYYPCFTGSGEENLTFSSPQKFEISKLKGKCGECKYKRICGGGCRMVAYSLTGDFYESMDTCVTMIREKYGIFD